MITCFLSHSSKDKVSYVQLVADRLPKQWRIYDADTFESGMKTLDEILRTLDRSDLFVLFLSDASLNSEWVKKEITEAKSLLASEKIKKIYPVVIDRSITFNDARIPDWMREEYNLRAVTRPSLTVRRIRQRLMELSWEAHPRLKERQKIFVGRNTQISEIEERFDDYSLRPPTCVICSGLPLIGRRTLLRRAIAKVGAIRESYSPAEIVITSQESIEDFIVKVYDLGFSSRDDISNLMNLSLGEKLDLATALCKDVSDLNEILLIEDTGGIVTYERRVVAWFASLLDNLSDEKQLIIAVASRFRPNHEIRFRKDVFVVPIPELTRTERMGLFKRVAEFERLSLTSDDYAYFEDLLFGFPDQVFYTVNLIKELGLPELKRKTELLVEFNTDRAARLVELNAPTDQDKEFLYLLSEFDFISYDLLSSIVDIAKYEHTLQRFLASAMCETLGANQEYIRLNDSIRDYMRRLRVPLPKDFSAKLQDHINHFLKSYESEDIDASDYLYSVRRALAEGKPLSHKTLIPSHFLNAMKDLYDRHRKPREVVTLADRALESEPNLDPNITREIRYFLCQSLARLRDSRLLSEVQKISGPEHNFLLGFYYRMCGRTADAIQQQLRAISETRTASRARRELVQLYVNVEDFESARILAEQNYSDRPSNPFHIQAYLKCLINAKDWDKYKDIIQKLLNGLQKAELKFERAEEMRLNALAQYQAYCLGEIDNAQNTIDDAIAKFPNNPYPRFTKISILFRQRALPSRIEKELAEIDKIVQSETLFKDALLKLRAQLLYLKGQSSEASVLSHQITKNVPDERKTIIASNLQKLAAVVSVDDE